MSPESSTASAIRIEGATPQDLPALAELRWRWVLENEGAPIVSRAEFHAVFADWALGAQRIAPLHRRAARGDGHRHGGLAVVPRVPSSRAPVRASGDVQSVYVVPADRNSGIGGRILAAVLARAFEAGLERVTVHSTAGAVTAYERAGFSASARLLQATRTP